jgi:predicted esterase
MLLTLCAVALSTCAQEIEKPALPPHPELVEVEAESAPDLSPDLRYELGVRLRAMEAAFEEADEQTRRDALPQIEKAVSSFFSLNLPEAARALDMARHHLAGTEPTWTDSVAVTVSPRFAETGTVVHLGLSAIYSSEVPSSYKVVTSFTRDRSEINHFPTVLQTESIPRVTSVEGWEYPGWNPMVLAWTSEAGARVRPIDLTADRDIRKRATSMQALRKSQLDQLDPWVTATSRLHLELLSGLMRGEQFETNLAGDEILFGLEALLKETTTPHGNATIRSWINGYRPLVPCGLAQAPPPYPNIPFVALPREVGGRDVMRVFVPNLPRNSIAKLPLIIAMHGAGGSENMFVDGYGNGKVTWLADEHQYIVVSPRMSVGTDIEALVDQLVPLLGADRNQVFLLGHSMGAAAAIDAARKASRPYAGLLLLGGGRSVRTQDLPKFLSTPIYLAAGERDFALPGTNALAKQLETAEHEDFTYQVVPNTEHLTVVQVALDECFAWIKHRAKPLAD